ncbi:MAG: tetratricopeptide repeat protein [Rhodanobacteraceae bacterium]|nr:MAG: tetratricopeptide repeat protein [Rhodanobacteraceae bacterium]
MTIRFLVIAAVMVVAALACVLVPLLRSARREGQPRAPFVLALVLALAVPPVVLGAYLAIGTPQALHAVPVDGQSTLVEATRQLRESLARKPDDAQGWALLAQAYSALDEPQQALDALNHLLKLKPDDPDAMVAWVEATAATDPSHLIDDEARAKLQRALQVEPTHQRALWLLGISDFQRRQYADAAKQWKTLLPLLQPGSKVAATVQQELADAQAHAGAGAADVADAATGAPPASPTPTTNDSDVAIRVKVTIEDQLLDRMKPGDTLFVFARAVDGPPMPLAVAKLGSVQFPATVTLTDAMAMSPSLRLSQYRKVQVVARLSASGNALPQAGDLESTPMEVATDTRAPVTLTIDKVD